MNKISIILLILCLLTLSIPPAQSSQMPDQRAAASTDVENGATVAEKPAEQSDQSVSATASHVKPMPQPVITAKGIPSDIKISAKEAAKSLRSFPVQNPANLPKQVPPTKASISAAPTHPLHGEKRPSNGVPNVPDPHVYLQGGDNFGSATVIPSIPYNDAGTTQGYYNDYEGNCGLNGAPDVVYRFDATVNMSVTISLCGNTSFDSKLYVCINGDPNNILACNDDYCSLQSELDNLPFLAANSYFIVVDGYSDVDYGYYTINVTAIIPPPDPCPAGENYLYDNGSPDGLNAVSAFRSTDGTYDRWVVDDMVFANQVIIQDFHWLCVSTDNFDWNQTDDFMILADNAGAPGAVLYDIRNVSNTRSPTGRMPFGWTEYTYTIQGLNIVLPAGRYWLGLRPVSASSYNSWWETSPVQGSPIYVSYPDLGYPMWTQGGQVFGAEYDVSFCVTGQIWTPPSPCGGSDVLYDNGRPDGVNGWYDFRTLNPSVEYFIVNDVTFNNSVIIHDLHWYAVESQFDWNGTDDFIITADIGGAPGATLYEVRDVANTRYATGNMPFGLPEYVYSIQGLNINLPAGRYWVGLRPVGYSTPASYWETAPIQGAQAYIDYTPFGYPRWTPGSTYWGQEYDFAFCVTGEIAPPPDPCVGGDVLYYNGSPDLVNGVFAGRSLDGTWNEWVVDDVALANPVIIHDFHWYVLDNGSDWNGTDDILILRDTIGVPGPVVYSLNDVPNTRTATGRTNFGLPEYIYEIAGVSLPLPAGRYWVGMRPVGYHNPATYWETAPITGSPAFIKYPYWGFPAWTPGIQSWGADYDVSFCITGEVVSGCQYVPGDINGNGTANGIDVVFGVNYLKGTARPPVDCGGICPESSPFYAAGDVNGNCAFNGIDITFFVRYLKGQVPSLLYCPDCPPAMAPPAPAAESKNGPLFKTKAGN